jgi:hypothetical protein
MVSVGLQAGDEALDFRQSETAVVGAVGWALEDTARAGLHRKRGAMRYGLEDLRFQPR